MLIYDFTANLATRALHRALLLLNNKTRQNAKQNNHKIRDGLLVDLNYLKAYKL